MIIPSIFLTLIHFFDCFWPSRILLLFLFGWVPVPNCWRLFWVILSFIFAFFGLLTDLLWVDFLSHFPDFFLVNCSLGFSLFGAFLAVLHADFPLGFPFFG